MPGSLKILAALAVAGAAVWAFVNYVPDFVARHLVNSELEAMGIDTQGVKTLNLRPWNNEIWMGPVGLRPLDSDVKPAAVKRIGVKYDLLQLFQRRALITDMTIAGIDIEIERDAEGDFTINGIELRRYLALEDEAPSQNQPAPEDGERWGAGLDVLTLTDSRVFFDDLTRGTLTLEVDELKLEGFRTWAPDNPGTFELTGRLNDIDIHATCEARSFGDEITLSFATKVDRGSWEKVLAYTGPTFEFERQGGEFSSEGRHQLDITADGGLVFYSKTLFTITDVAAARPDGIAGRYDKGVITLDTRTALDENGDMEVLGTTTYAIEGMQLTMPDGQVIDLVGVNAIFDNMKAEIAAAGTAKIRVRPAFVVRGAALDGPATGSLDRLFIELGEVNVSTAGNRLSINLSGSAGLESLSVSSPVELDLAALRMDLANVDVLQQGGALSIKGAATAAAGTLKTDLPEQPGQPAIHAAFETLDVALSDLSVDRTAAALQWRTGMTLDTSDLVVVIGEGELARAKAGRATLKDAAIDQSTDQSLAFTAAELVIAKLQAELSDKLATAFGGGDKDAGSGESAPPPTVKLGRLAFVDGARVLYEDTAVDPRVEVSVDAKTLEIDNIDTGDPNRRTDLKVVANVNEFANVDAAGWTAPLAAEPTFDLTANVQGLQLVAFSPYAARAVGMRLESGTLSTRATAAANQGKLRATVKLTLDDLGLSPVSQADAKRLSARVGIPVETAVAMLQDPDGAIRLELPVSGTTQSPDIDLSQVISKAIGGAFGALIGGGGGKDGGVAFNPITFEAGSTALTQDGIALANSLAQMLKQRPKLSVDVCGRVTSQDLLAYANARGIALPAASPAIPEKARADLNKLAAERTRAVRQFVSTGHGIEPSRIEECRPTFDPADTGPPRVDIKM